LTISTTSACVRVIINCAYITSGYFRYIIEAKIMAYKKRKGKMKGRKYSRKVKTRETIK